MLLVHSKLVERQVINFLNFVSSFQLRSLRSIVKSLKILFLAKVGSVGIESKFIKMGFVNILKQYDKDSNFGRQT